MLFARRAVAVATAALALTLLAGCTGDPLAANFGGSDDKANYPSGGGVYVEIADSDRGAPVTWSGTTDAGDAVSSDDFSGDVYVVNFWYAGCPPCRLEAPLLQAVSEKYAGTVDFVGVNLTDQAAVSQAFAKKFGVTYPSVIDTNTAAVQSAFAASVPPNAVPVTLIVDREGRVAARWSGLIESKATLSSLIDRVVEEG